MSFRYSNDEGEGQRRALKEIISSVILLGYTNDEIDCFDKDKITFTNGRLRTHPWGHNPLDDDKVRETAMFEEGGDGCGVNVLLSREAKPSEVGTAGATERMASWWGFGNPSEDKRITISHVHRGHLFGSPEKIDQLPSVIQQIDLRHHLHRCLSPSSSLLFVDPKLVRPPPPPPPPPSASPSPHHRLSSDPRDMSDSGSVRSAGTGTASEGVRWFIG
ncbi:hypothetical protein QJS04_geneDACA023292 [Acorus gramineus]|uniref:Uncharacterized protein n=1 Tax=Acorus gramineus TaxID=55184 RepID=A0AAV9BSD1_ACOGR|nr:hypothetical protein QJS04_geneDACA023292 [Acorus gramineus]